MRNEEAPKGKELRADRWPWELKGQCGVWAVSAGEGPWKGSKEEGEKKNSPEITPPDSRLSAENAGL